MPEFIADKVHAQKNLWRIDIGAITGYFMQNADADGTLWFPLKDENMNENQITEWNMHFSLNLNKYEIGLVVIEGKWSLAQDFHATDDEYEKRISWQTHIFSIMNSTNFHV
ncbi:hypothetical protein ACXWYY_002924 [Enterobacter hormaechei]